MVGLRIQIIYDKNERNLTQVKRQFFDNCLFPDYLLGIEGGKKVTFLIKKKKGQGEGSASLFHLRLLIVVIALLMKKTKQTTPPKQQPNQKTSINLTKAEGILALTFLGSKFAHKWLLF